MRARCLRATSRADGPERGSIVLEAAAAIPALLVLAVGLLQVGLICFGFSAANGAARAAARAQVQGESARAAAESSLPGVLQRDLRVTPSGAGSVEVVVTVPSLIPMFGPMSVTRAAVLPAEG